MDNILFIPGIRSTSFDPDASAYSAAVEFSDAQSLEPAVRTAINSFVVGCKADGIWSAIACSCILAGARTLDGALVPLKGLPPTNIGPFVSGDYNRKTGLTGNGSTKYLDTNRNNNADPQNNQHISVFVTSVGTATRAIMGRGTISTGATQFILNASANGLVNRSQSSVSFDNIGSATGFQGVSRSGAASYTARSGGSNFTNTTTSQTPFDGNVFMFARGTAAPQDFYNGGIAWYSSGTALDLALLNARLTTLINTFGAVI